MQTEREQLEAGLAAIEAQRSSLGDAIVDATVAPIRSRLAELDAAEKPQQRLKQVSILFLDVVGSTSLSERLDPEDIAAVINRVLEEGTVLAEAHGGRVLQYAGDNLLAAFGVDASLEDDAERAVRCGLALVALGRRYAAAPTAVGATDGPNVRVGVHTGEVLLGGGIEANGAIRGMAVNVAARMEQTAPVGALRISHDTYRQVRGLFDVDPQPPLLVKGIDRPIQTYLVVRSKPRAFGQRTRGVEGVVTRMIGREAEFDELRGAFRALFDTRRFAALTVTGDAGIGKSRLLDEFAAWTEAQPESFALFRARANPQTERQPYGLLRDLVADHLRIADDDALAVARRKIEDGIVPLFVDDDGRDLAEGHAHLLGHLIGIEWRTSPHVRGILDDPRQIRNRAFHAAAQWFRRIGARAGTPVVLELEDLHWADHESLDFLGYLADTNRDSAMLVLAFGRQTLFERRARWCPDELHRLVELAPLGDELARQLADELLRKLPDVPPALRDILTGGSQGNPFYMEELVNMLIDQETIAIGDVWTADADRLLRTNVPGTLTGVLQARLDSLAKEERATLQQASVIGQVFWDRALFALDPRAEETLPALVVRSLTMPSAGSAGDELREYAFKHALMHQVTYSTVLRRLRIDLHGKLARWLAAQTGLRANDFLGIAAEHFEKAGDVGNAIEFYARAAAQAEQRMAFEAVHANVLRGLTLLDALPPTPQASAHRWRLLAAREATLTLQGDRTAQLADIVALEHLAEEEDDDRHRAYAALRRSLFGMRTSDHRTMLEHGRRAAAIAERTGEDELRLRAQRLVAFGLADDGELDAARALANAVLDEALAKGLHHVAGGCLNALAVIADMLGDPLAALDAAERALVADRASNNTQNEAVDRANVGAGWLLLGDAGRVRTESHEGLRLIRASGDRAMECVPLCNLSMVALWDGAAVEAAEYARAAVATASAVHAQQLEVVALLRLGDAQLALGQADEARDAYLAAQAVAEELDSALRHDALAGLACAALARMDLPAATAALAELIAMTGDEAIDRALRAADRPRWIEWTCHRVLRAIGDGRADEWLRRAHGALMAQADRIADLDVRAGYLLNIPHHREIGTAFGALGH